uniref:Na(+)/H(+) exchange regulatory cofactor NHE-RF n=1 Tax=Nothobranchius kadleci TaxID=1051664 RepID=A0A1A8C922_NOTKA
MSHLRPRLCVLEKGTQGYGFHLHGDRNRAGQFIRLVEDESPAAVAGLLAGDRIMFVNGENVEGESHQQVVARIRATTGALELIVVDPETAEMLKKHDLQCRKEFVTEGVPLPAAGNGDSDSNSTGTPREASPVPEENGDRTPGRGRGLSGSSGSKAESTGARPRLCHMQKGTSGYGFNLHSEKSKPGQFIRAVDAGSPAELAGLRPQDKIIQVNGVPVAGMQHSEVVTAIKAGGDETRLLVIDADTEEFFKRCNVLPTEEHVAGPLPEPAPEGAADETDAAQLKPKVSVSSSSSDSSNASMPAEAHSSPPHPQVEPATASDSLGLSMSLAQAKERAHQKRAAKKAPPMDWSKRNELFGNL